MDIVETISAKDTVSDPWVEVGGEKYTRCWQGPAFSKYPIYFVLGDFRLHFSSSWQKSCWMQKSGRGGLSRDLPIREESEEPLPQGAGRVNRTELSLVLLLITEEVEEQCFRPFVLTVGSL